jgi:hypothetical protein
MRCTFGLCALILLTTVPSRAQEQNTTDASVTLAAQSRRFVMGEPICVRVTLRITGITPLIMPTDVRQYWLFTVTPPEGETLYGRAGPIVCPLPGTEHLRRRVMLPGEVITYDVNLINEVPELFGSSGMHEVELKIDSRYESGVLTHTPLHSQPLRIQIDQPAGVNAKAYKEMLASVRGNVRRTADLFYIRDELSKLITEEYPGSIYAAYAHFELGNNLLDRVLRLNPGRGRPITSDQEALLLVRKHYAYVLTHHPKFAFKHRLLLRSAQAWHYIGNHFAARRDLTVLLDSTPDTETATESKWLYSEIKKEEDASP